MAFHVLSCRAEAAQPGSLFFFPRSLAHAAMKLGTFISLLLLLGLQWRTSQGLSTHGMVECTQIDDISTCRFPGNLGLCGPQVSYTCPYLELLSPAPVPGPIHPAVSAPAPCAGIEPTGGSEVSRNTSAKIFSSICSAVAVVLGFLCFSCSFLYCGKQNASETLNANGQDQVNGSAIEKEPRRTPLNWAARLKIAVESARGLAYLHHDLRIVHRDIKSANICLDVNLEVHLSNFRLAKPLDDDESHGVPSVLPGSVGYRAPEVIRRRGRATEKAADVYSYGVVLLELLTGKRPLDKSFVNEGLNVVSWVRSRTRKNRHKDIFDPKCPSRRRESMEIVLQIALECVAEDPERRASMEKVVRMLEPLLVLKAPKPCWSLCWC